MENRAKQRLLWPLMAGFLTLSQSYAQENVSIGSYGPSINIFSAGLETSLSSNLENPESDQLQQSLDISATFKIENRAGTWSAAYNGTKALTDEREYQAADGSIGWSKLIKKTDATSYSLMSSLVLPFSETSAQEAMMYTRLTVGASAKYAINDFLGLNQVSLSWSPRLGKGFHQYTTTKSGKSNNEYSISNQAVLGLAITDTVGIDILGRYTRHWTYEQNTRDVFLFDQSIIWSASPNISISLGHNNEGNALAANGLDSGVEVFDLHTSTIYTTLGISLP